MQIVYRGLGTYLPTSKKHPMHKLSGRGFNQLLCRICISFKVDSMCNVVVGQWFMWFSGHFILMIVLRSEIVHCSDCIFHFKNYRESVSIRGTISPYAQGIIVQSPSSRFIKGFNERDTFLPPQNVFICLHMLYLEEVFSMK